MTIELISKEEKQEVELRHRYEGDGRVRDSNARTNRNRIWGYYLPLF